MEQNNIDNIGKANCDNEVVDCFLCTKKGHQALKENENELTVRQRQLLFSLSKNDTISRSVSEHLLTKISIKDLVEEGLVKQDSPCNTWCPKLQAEQKRPQQVNRVSQANTEQPQEACEVSSEIELLARFTA